MLADLARSGLTIADAALLKVTPLTAAQVQGLTETDLQVTPFPTGYLIPYWKPGATAPRPTTDRAFRVRLLEEPTLAGHRKTLRYLSPSNAVPHLYFPPNVDWAHLAPNAEIWFVEGEKKAARLARAGVAAIGVGGVWSFMSRKAGIPVLEEFDLLPWAGRPVVIAYDSDLVSNPMVLSGLRGLADVLAGRGTLPPRIAFLPADGANKVGMDDFLEAVRARSGDEREALVELRAAGVDHSKGKKLWELNERFAWVHHPAGFFNVSSSIPTFLGKTVGPFHAATGAIVEERMTPSGPRVEPVSKTWVNWPMRREHPRIVYEPGLPPILDDGSLNIWRNRLPAPARDDAAVAAHWTKLLSTLIPDAGLRAYVEAWVAFPLRNPGAKIHQALLLVGTEQGTGKTQIAMTIGALYGGTAVGSNFHMVGTDELYSSFNEWAYCRQLILGDEIFSVEHRGASDFFKNIITRSTATINQKGVSHFVVRDSINYVFTSNHLDAIKLERKDRRFIVVKVPEGVRLDEVFYARYGDWLRSPAAGAALAHHFTRVVDISQFNPYADAPMTEAKAAMIDLSVSDLERWVAEILADPPAILDRLGDEGLGDIYTASDVVEDYFRLHPNERSHGGVAAAMGRALSNGGVPSRTSHQNFYCLRNRERWTAVDRTLWAAHYNVTRGRLNRAPLDQRPIVADEIRRAIGESTNGNGHAPEPPAPRGRRAPTPIRPPRARF